MQTNIGKTESLTCGKCNRVFDDHPNEHCPIYYVAIRHPITNEIVGWSYNTRPTG